MRKTNEQVNVQQGAAKGRRSISIVLGNMTDDFTKVVQCSLRVEEALVHLCRSWRTFLEGTAAFVNRGRGFLRFLRQ